jgi:mono/diheme cytochrome c family protein
MQRIFAIAAFAVFLCSGCSHLQMGYFMMRSNEVPGDKASIALGRDAFLHNCSGCHGENADGKGADAANFAVPPTNFRSEDYKKTAKRLAARIAYGKGDDMPAFSSRLSEESIWHIANYLHSLQPES